MLCHHGHHQAKREIGLRSLPRDNARGTLLSGEDIRESDSPCGACFLMLWKFGPRQSCWVPWKE